MAEAKKSAAPQATEQVLEKGLLDQIVEEGRMGKDQGAKERGKELVRNQNIPQATLDQRAADEEAAQASVMEAQAALDQAEINLGYGDPLAY